MFCFDAIWPSLFCAVFVDGGIWIGSFGRRFRNGSLGSLLFGFRPRLRICWKEFFVLLGGLFGCLGIALFFIRIPLVVRRFLITLCLVLSIGVIVDVIGCSHGRIG